MVLAKTVTTVTTLDFPAGFGEKLKRNYQFRRSTIIPPPIMLNNYDLVGGFPYIGNNHPNWLIFSGGLKPPTRLWFNPRYAQTYWCVKKPVPTRKNHPPSGPQVWNHGTNAFFCIIHRHPRLIDIYHSLISINWSEVDIACGLLVNTTVVSLVLHDIDFLLYLNMVAIGQ